MIVPGTFGDRPEIDRALRNNALRSHSASNRRLFDEAARCFVVRQQRLDLSQQLAILATGGIQKGPPLYRVGQLQSRREDPFFVGSLARHRCIPVESSSSQCDETSPLGSGRPHDFGRIDAQPAVALDRLMQPCPRVTPIPLGSYGGNAEQIRRFFVRQAGEKPQLDQPGLERLFGRETLQGLVQARAARRRASARQSRNPPARRGLARRRA